MGRVVRRALLFAAFAGCQSTPAPPPASAPLPPPTPTRTAARVAESPAPMPPKAPDPPPTPAKETVAVEPPTPDDPLALAADCLERGDLPAAARHLEAHVREFPDQVIFRAQLADLLARMERLPDAQAHFEAAAASAQDGPPVLQKERVHYHTRLMEIAQERHDDYAEHLHRGIGLYLVAVRLVGRDGDAGEIERLLCKAALALQDAQATRPDDARAAWYLYKVWSQLDQPRPAAKALRQAAAAASFSTLTPVEARELALVSRPEVVMR
jgi:tetratricopeptide (TPR) repeat protein